MRGQPVEAELTSPTDVARLRIYLLGGFRVDLPEGPVPETAWQRRSAKRLVKLLATESSHRMHREQVIDLFWPDMDPKGGLAAFRQALHQARHALEPSLGRNEPSSFLHFRDDIVSLNVELTVIDADQFEEQARRALDSTLPELFDAALGLFAGHLLPEDRYEEWTQQRRDSLDELYIVLLLGQASLLERLGDAPRAIASLRRALDQDPAREDVHRLLMRLYAATGSRHQALRQYQICRDVLRRELDVAPDAETEAEYQRLLTGAPMSAAPDPSTSLPRPARLRIPGPLIGRETVLDSLRDMMRRSAATEGGTVLLGGEAGVGKSRVAAEIARLAHEKGHLVLWGASYDQQGKLPYGPFVEALNDYLSRRSVSERASFAQRYPEAARLVPAVASEVEPPASAEAYLSAVGAESERAHLFASMVRLFADLGQRRPLLLVLDDLQASDAASLHLLNHLARVAGDYRWLILGTYREEDVVPGSDFQRLCAVATREGFCRRVDLLRLSRPDTDRLVRSLLSDGEVAPSLLDRLYALSLGNPLFVQELVRTMQERGDLTLYEGRWSDATYVPSQVRDLLESRIQRADDSVLRVLSLTAVAGEEVTFHLLRTAAGLLGPTIQEAQLLDAVDCALDMHILEERGNGYAFRHPLLRAAIYERLSRSRRAHLHGIIGQALEALPGAAGGLEALAFHFARSGRDDKAAAYLEQAGDRAFRVFANQEAEACYRQALDHLSEGDALARVHEKIGTVLTVLARYDEALEALEAAAAMYLAQDRTEPLLRCVACIGRAHALRSSALAGVKRVDTFMETLPTDVPPAALAELHAVRAQLYFFTGRYSQSLEAAALAADLAREIGSDRLLAEAEQWHGTALSMVGRVEEGIAVLEESIRLCQSVGDLMNLSRALNNAAEIYEFGGEFERSRQYIERGLEVARRLGDPARVAFMTRRLGDNAFFRGRWTEAKQHLESALTLITTVKESWFTPYAYLSLGRLAAAEGRDEEARFLLERASSLGKEAGDLQAYRAAQGPLAELDIDHGQPDVACKRLSDLLFDPKVEVEEVTHLLPLFARAHLEAGHSEIVGELVVKGLAQAEREHDRLSLVGLLRVRAQWQAQQRAWPEAHADIERCLAVFATMPFPYAEAQILETWGRIWWDEGKRDEGRKWLSRALELYDGLGAAGGARRVRSLLSEE